MKLFRSMFTVVIFITSLIVGETIAQSPMGIDVNMPSVPRTVLKRTSSGMNGTGSTGTKPRAEGSNIVSMRSNSNQFIINVTPGINQLLPIAVNHINRIVTPFDTPFINTVSNATINAHKNVIYVATKSEAPVSLFVTPDVNDESMAISLTLAPKQIPPIEAKLVFDDSPGTSGIYYSNEKAKKWETSQPYVETIKKTLKSLALGKLPSGYSMGVVNEKSILPTCVQEDLSYDFVNGQYLQGYNFIVAIGTVKNDSEHTIEIDETQCIDGHIVAAASWPLSIFEPGDVSEMYVVMRTDLLKRKDHNLRPSLLDN